jgi:hypothetical protein
LRDLQYSVSETHLDLTEPSSRAYLGASVDRARVSEAVDEFSDKHLIYPEPTQIEGELVPLYNEEELAYLAEHDRDAAFEAVDEFVELHPEWVNGLFPDKKESFLKTAHEYARTPDSLKRHYMFKAMEGTVYASNHPDVLSGKVQAGQMKMSKDGKYIGSLAPFLSRRIQDIKDMLRKRFDTEPTSPPPPDPRLLGLDITIFDNAKPPERESPPSQDDSEAYAAWLERDKRWQEMSAFFEQNRDHNDDYHAENDIYTTVFPEGHREWEIYNNRDEYYKNAEASLDGILQHPELWSGARMGGDGKPITKEAIFSAMLLNGFEGERILETVNRVIRSFNDSTFESTPNKRPFDHETTITMEDIKAFGDGLGFKNITDVFQGEHPNWQGYASGQITEQEEGFFRENVEFGHLVRGLGAERRQVREDTLYREYLKKEAGYQTDQRYIFDAQQQEEPTGEPFDPKPAPPLDAAEIEEADALVNSNFLDNILAKVDGIDWGELPASSVPVTQRDLAHLFQFSVNNSQIEEAVEGYGQASGELKPSFRQVMDAAGEPTGQYQRILYGEVEDGGDIIGYQDVDRSEIGTADTSLERLSRFENTLLWSDPITDRTRNPIDMVIKETEGHIRRIIGKNLSEDELEEIEETVMQPVFDKYWGIEASDRDERQQQLRPDSDYRDQYFTELQSALVNYQNLSSKTSYIPEDTGLSQGDIDRLSVDAPPLRTKEDYDISPLPRGWGYKVNDVENLSHLVDKIQAGAAGNIEVTPQMLEEFLIREGTIKTATTAQEAEKNRRLQGTLYTQDDPTEVTSEPEALEAAAEKLKQVQPETTEPTETPFVEQQLPLLPQADPSWVKPPAEPEEDPSQGAAIDPSWLERSRDV